MKHIYFFSSDGFPSIKYPNLGIFTFEQVKYVKNYKAHLFDFQTNNSNKIYLDSFQNLKIYRMHNTKFNILKILQNLIFIFFHSFKYKPLLIISSFLNFKNIIYSFLINTKKIVIIHGSDANVINKLKKIIFRIYLKKVFRIFCVSSYTKKVLLKNFNNKIVKKKTFVVHNGFERDKLNNIDIKFLKKINKKKKSILTVANLVPRKNIKTIVEIFDEINKKFRDKFELNIVGDGVEKIEILKLIKKFKLEKNVNLFSNLTNSQVSALYEKSNFFFLFSKNYKNEFEGFGIVFLEAMYKKNIVFASNHGGIKDIIFNEKNGFLFDVNRKNFKNTVINKFFKVLQQKKMQKKIIKYSSNFVKNFSWEKNINEILKRSIQ